MQETLKPSPTPALLKPGVMKALPLAVTVVALVIATALPFAGSGYVTRLATLVLMYAALGQAWNFIGGYTGYAAFGNTLFFGVGAYTNAMLMLAGAPFVLGILSGAVVGALFAALIGLPVLRLRGHYFAIATLGVGEAIREIVNNMDWLGAATGLNLPMAREQRLFYFLMLGMVVLLAAVTFWLERSRLGYAFVAIRENEEAAASLGIDTSRYKVIAFALTGFFTGMVGAVYSYWVTFIDPSIVFTPAISIQAILVTLLGGPGTLVGPILGALLLETGANLIWANFLSWHDTFLGAMIVISVLFLPRGIMALYPFRRLTLAALLSHVRSSRI